MLIFMKEALYYEALADQQVRCGLCHHGCIIRCGRRGICGVRENRDGRLYSLVYGRLTAEAVDPIEKKPLYHFLPGSTSFSVATRGCNFRCLHCQNCTISQVTSDVPLNRDRETAPQQLVAVARGMGCKSISYTYTEPTIFYEYALDTARLAAAAGLKNVFVTNGYITPDPLREIAPVLDAANIDLKFFDEKMYREVCGAHLQPVLDTIGLYYELGIWIEITTLIIPEHNDDDEQLRKIAEFIAGLDTAIPWHVTGFYPVYKLQHVPPATVAMLRRARRIGYETGLKNVYTGNLPDDEGCTTYCPECRAELIVRGGRRALVSSGFDGVCEECGGRLAGVFATN